MYTPSLPFFSSTPDLVPFVSKLTRPLSTHCRASSNNQDYFLTGVGGWAGPAQPIPPQQSFSDDLDKIMAAEKPPKAEGKKGKKSKKGKKGKAEPQKGGKKDGQGDPAITSGVLASTTGHNN